MASIRRYALLLIVLLIGIFLGTFGWRSALVFVIPLLMLWIMVWDEKTYEQKQAERHTKTQQPYTYKNTP